MFKLQLFKQGLFVALSLLLLQAKAFAQTTFTWNGGVGSWATAANWTKGPGPSTSTFPNSAAGQNDLAVINSGQATASSNISNNSLTAVTINGGTLIVSASVFTCSGSITGAGTFSQTGGTVNVSGDVSVSNFSASAGTFVYNGTGPQAVKAGTYNIFQKTGAGGTATLAGNVVAAATTISSGTLDLGGNNFNATTLTGAGDLTLGSGTLTLSGSNTQSGTFNSGSGTVVYTGALGQTVRGTTYNNLTFSGAGIKNLASSTLVVNGTMTTACNIDQNNFAITFNGPVVWSAGSISAGTGNAVTYNSSANQDVIPTTIATTSLTKSGTGTATLKGNYANTTAGVNLNGGTLDLGNFNLNTTSLSGGGTLTAGSGTITLTGSNSHSGIFNAGTSSFVYNLNGAQIIQGCGASGYYNLTISGNNTKTLANALTVNNQFTFTGSGTFAIGNNACAFNHFGQTAGTVAFGTAAVSYAGNFNKTGGTYTAGSGSLTFSGTGFIRSNAAITFSTVPATIDGIRTIQSAGTVTFSDITVNGTLSNKTNLVVITAFSGPGTFSHDSTTSSLDVNFIGAGPSVANFNVNVQGTVRYNAAGAQSTRAVAYYNLSGSNSGIKTLSPGTTVANNLSVGSPIACAFNLNIPGNISGTALLSITGNSTLGVTGNYTSTGGLTISGTGAFNANGNVAHGAGALSFNASTVSIAGILNGTGAVSFSGGGSLTFTGGGWTSTAGTFTNGGVSTTYSGTSGSQTVRSTTYTNLTLSGAATKNYGTGATGSVSGIFNNLAGQKLIFPNTAATLALNGTVAGTGELLGAPAGTLTIGAAGASNSLGTLYFDTTNAFGSINFNRQWNRGNQVRIGSSVRLNAYTFGGALVGGVEIADGQVFKLESTTVTATSTLPANVGRSRFIMLGTGSKFVFEPTGTIPAGTNLTFPIGPMPTATIPYDVLAGNATGTLNAANIGDVTINGTGTNFNDQVLVGYNLSLSNGTIIGEVASYVSASQITLKAPGAQVAFPAGSTFRLIQVYRPVVITPSVAVAGGSLEVGILNHSGGLVTSGTNVPNDPTNRRTNYIYQIRATGGFPTSAIWTESLISNDYNATIDDSKYTLFRWNGSFWIKLSGDLIGPGIVPGNRQLRRNTVANMPGVQTYILGQTGGVLPDDPTFFWTGAGGNSNWKQAGNWSVFPPGAGNWPDDIGHSVIINSSGIGNPILQTGDSVNVKNIFHTAKQLRIQNNGILNILGNYSFNPPSITASGTGRLIQTGFSITGTNNSQFISQLSPGALLYTTEGGFIGAVQSVASNSALTLHAIGGGAAVNIPDSSTFNIISPSISAGPGILSASTISKVVTGTGFTSALNGRALYVGANLLVGFVAQVQSSTSLLLVNNSLRNATNAAYLISSAVVPSGSATTNFENGSKVNYNNSNDDQTIAATSYSNLTMMDNRVGGNTNLNRYVNCPGQTITIRGRYRGRSHVKPSPTFGTVWQFTNGSRMSFIFPSGSVTATAGVWSNFPIAGISGVYNVKWGTLATDRVSYDAFLQHNAAVNFPAMDATIGSRFGDFSIVNTAANSRWNLIPGMTFTVNGTFSLSNTSGPANDVINFGNSTASPAVGLTLLGNISGLNNIRNNGVPVHLGDITIAGTGTISGDLFENVSQVRNLTVNRTGISLNLTGALNLNVTEKITVSNGTFGHTGSGTISVGNGAATGVEVTGGTFDMSGSSNLSLISPVGFTVSGGIVNLNNTGFVSIAGSFSQTGGTFNRPANPITLQGNVSSTAGTCNFLGSTVSMTGTNAQSLVGPASGLTFSNVIIDKTGGAVIISGGKIRILGSVDFPATNTANLATTASGNLTLVSNASGTARIGEVLGGGLAGNNFTMQRFVPGSTPGWYFLGTPVTGQLLGDWADDFTVNTPLTCAGTLTGIPDRCTVYKYEGDAVPINGPNSREKDGWRVPTSCAVNPGEGNVVFFGSNLFGSGSTIDNTGGMNFGNTPLNVTFNALGFDGGGWNMVSNPFPSNIDWDNGPGWTKTNIQNAIYVFRGGIGQYGSYINGLSTNGVDNIIPSSQAFLVRANASPALAVNENAKTISPKGFLRTAVNSLSLKLKLKQNEQSDETIIYFAEGATDGFDGHLDAAKLELPGLKLASILNDSKFTINGISTVQTEKRIPLSISDVEAGNLSFDISALNLEASNLEVILNDKYLGQQTQIQGNQSINFEVNENPKSKGNGRFELVFVNRDAAASNKNIGNQIFSLYPNPSKGGQITFQTGNTPGRLIVSDVLGRIVKTQSISPSVFETEFDSPATPGIYQVSFEGSEGSKFSTKLVVK